MAQLPSASELMAEAEAVTGLSDWGGDLFRKPFEVLIGDLNTTARLTELGASRARRRLSDTLRQRLMVVEDRKRFPRIADEQIIAPIFVAGLPRAGTTFFHNILSADPENRSPATWEIMFPSPPPQEATYAADPRITEASEALAFEGFKEPQLQAVHPFDARRPEECNFLWELSFLTVNYIAWWDVPNYAALFYATDPVLVYEEQRQVLQHLQHRFRRERWVLKTPAHNPWLAQLFEVFPDACVVQCHRDPAKIIASLSKNLAIWRKIFSDHVPAGSFGMLDLQAKGLANVAAFRGRPEVADRFFDAHYLAVQADPIGELARCYAQFGVDFTPERAATIAAWLEADRAGHAKGPRHTYALDDYGLDYAAVDKAMGDYIRTNSVQLER
jgi:sulfotransferase family protein